MKKAFIRSTVLSFAAVLVLALSSCSEMGTGEKMHKWDSGTVISEATCTQAGIIEYACTECGEKNLCALDPLGHNEVIDSMPLEATCTESGLTAAKHCTVCNQITSVQTVIGAKGHNEVIDAALAPTCTESGRTEGKHCSGCNMIFIAQTEISAAGHSAVTDAALAPTCTNDGLTEGSHCSSCGLVMLAQQSIPMIPHDSGSEEGTNCLTCNKTLLAVYDSYDAFANDCSVSSSGNTVTLKYDRELPAILKLSRFVLNGAANYILRFGSNSASVKLDGGGGTYKGIKLEVDQRSTDFEIELKSINLTNADSVITSSAPALNLKLSGGSVCLSTSSGADGSEGESFGAAQIGNGGRGGNGGSASTVIVCDGSLDITCAANTVVRGGNGGNGGDGGDSKSSGSSGGAGGNGGNGGTGVRASAVTVSFENGMGKDNISFIGGKGGNGGEGGYGSVLFGIGKNYADDGVSGTSGVGVNVTVQYN